jgi:hypothetical protein
VRLAGKDLSCYLKALPEAQARSRAAQSGRAAVVRDHERECIRGPCPIAPKKQAKP